MRIIFKKGVLRSTLRLCRWVLGAGGVLMLGYCGFVLADSWMFQRRENAYLERMLHTNQAAKAGFIPVAAIAPRTRTLPRMTGSTTGGLIGRIDIPRLGLSAIVMEGVGSKTLRRAAGHIPGTALPGEPGNIGISGHRDTFFRPLRNIRQGDTITLTTPLGEFRYRVLSTKIVSPSNVAVLDPSGTEILTLVTCYPFYYVGSAPNRFIVRAERII